MAILGVLLGITMTVLGYLLYEYRRGNAVYIEAINSLTARVEFLEKRKALLAEAIISAPKPAGVGGQKLRTWNEDAAPFEAKG